MCNVIINGDSLEELYKLEPESVDLIFADPPYYMRTEGTLIHTEGTEFKGCNDDWDKFDSLEDYESFTEEWLKACRRVMKNNASIWVIGSMQCIYTIGAIMQRLGFWFINDVIWHKKNPTPNFMGTRLNNSHETLIWAAKSKDSKITFHYKTAKELNNDSISDYDFSKGIRKQMGSVWKFSVCSGSERLKDSNGNKLHNTQKPVKMLERIIAISSNLNDLVLDPFAGTMTTAAAAKKLGRRFIMIEKNKSYCEYASKRLERINFQNDDISNAKFDVKPLKVSLKEIIESGFLKIGEYFSFKDGKPIAKLLENGKLLFENRVLDIHSCAAVVKSSGAKRLNGFDYWCVIRNGEVIGISEIREQYRNYAQKKRF